MAFRRHPTLDEQWREYCHRYAELLAQLPAIDFVLSTPARFEELLQRGVSSTKSQSVRLDELSPAEWVTLQEFVAHYQREWNTYFTATEFAAWFREVARRNA